MEPEFICIQLQGFSENIQTWDWAREKCIKVQGNNYYGQKQFNICNIFWNIVWYNTIWFKGWYLTQVYNKTVLLFSRGLSMYWINIIPKGRRSKGMEENNKIIIFHHNIYMFPLGPGQYVMISIMLTIWLQFFPICSMPLICWYKRLFLFVPNFNLA